MSIFPGEERRRLTAASVIINPVTFSVLIGHKIKYNKWEFPGGKVDANEKVLTAGLRELSEETGVVPDTYDFVNYWDHKKWMSFIFTGVSEMAPELREPEKHYAWHYVQISDFFELVDKDAMTKVCGKFAKDTLKQCLTKLNQRGIL